MSNEFVVLLAIFVSGLGGGISVAAWALAKQNRALTKEVQFLGTANNQLHAVIAKQAVLIRDLEAWIANPPAVPTSKPAFGPENDIW